MEEAKVTQVLDAFAKHGHSEKTGKDWSMSRVGLDNNESVFIFNPIAVGDVVEAKQNGEYKNWSKKRIDPRQEQLDRIEAKLDRLLGGTVSSADLPPNTVVGGSTQAVDKIFDVNTDKPIDLNDIPF